MDLPKPKRRKGEVLIRMKHAGINVMDVKTRKGGYDGAKVYATSLPRSLGGRRHRRGTRGGRAAGWTFGTENVCFP